MSWSIRFEPDALGDIAAAVRYYNRERAGLGNEFRRAVDHRALGLRRFPNAGAPVAHITTTPPARYVRTARFPYLIIYVVVGDTVRVVAIAHERRLPAFWVDRLPPTPSR